MTIIQGDIKKKVKGLKKDIHSDMDDLNIKRNDIEGFIDFVEFERYKYFLELINKWFKDVVDREK
jgi:hypothetical protein